MSQRLYSPLCLRLPSQVSSEQVFSRLHALKYCCWLDSALTGDRRSQFSFLCADPMEILSLARPVSDPLVRAEQWLATFQSQQVAHLPPFQGGIVGYLAYEFGRCFEKIPRAQHDEFSLPIAVLGLYDVVFAWDHEAHQGWLISQGFLPTSPNEIHDDAHRQERAVERAVAFCQFLQIPLQTLELEESSDAYRSRWLDACGRRAVRYASDIGVTGMSQYSPIAMAHGLTADQYETRLQGGWLGNFSSEGYRRAVERAREYICAGDIFQVNLSQRLLAPAHCSSAELYGQLRKVNAAPFAGYFDFGDAQIISASPERFISVREREIETRPIKGTRRRHGDPAEDQIIADELRSAVKDRAENTMIVDLLRNDLSRVCEIDSLRVDQLCEVEEYPYVLHLVSSIRGRLKSKATLTDLIAAVFPGGSITGAPKVRAMEIIAELEPTVRGPYCGSLGYCSSSGSMDWSILIRTVTASRGWWQVQVGGGIVAASDAAMEEEETWIKAAGMVAAMNRSN